MTNAERVPTQAQIAPRPAAEMNGFLANERTKRSELLVETGEDQGTKHQ